MERNRIFLFPLVFFLVLLLILPGCRKNAEPQVPEPGPEHEEPQTPEPDPEKEDPETPEPGGKTESPPEPRVLALEKTDIRTLRLEPTAGSISINRQFIYYLIPGAPGNDDRLIDLFGVDYPLPLLDTVEVPILEAAVWKGGNLYYLSRDGINESEDIALYVYDTSSHTAAEHRLNFPDSFDPLSFFVTWEREVFFVGETGTYKYTLAGKAVERVAEFNLSWEILARASWHPYELKLIYSEGNKLMSLDILSGQSTLLYQAEGEITEFCWDDFGPLTVLIGNRVEMLDENGKFLSSHFIREGAYSLGWVPMLDMVSYLVRDGSGALSQFVIEDFAGGLRYTCWDCDGYIWTWESNLWTYSRDPETDDTNLVYSHIHWQPGQDTKVEIPYFKSREEDPKLPLNYAQGDFGKIAAELFTLHMKDLKSQGSISDFKLHGVTFWQEELWGFQVLVDYSVRSTDESWQAGNGDLGKDGWVNNKSNFICIYRDEDYYVMGSLWSTSP